MIRNVKYHGEWFDVEFTKEDVELVRTKNMEKNIEIAKQLVDKTQDGDGIGREILAALVMQSTQHWVYALDQVALKRIAKTIKERTEGGE